MVRLWKVTTNVMGTAVDVHYVYCRNSEWGRDSFLLREGRGGEEKKVESFT